MPSTGTIISDWFTLKTRIEFLLESKLNLTTTTCTLGLVDIVVVGWDCSLGSFCAIGLDLIYTS